MNLKYKFFRDKEMGSLGESGSGELKNCRENSSERIQRIVGILSSTNPDVILPICVAVKLMQDIIDALLQGHLVTHPQELRCHNEDVEHIIASVRQFLPHYVVVTHEWIEAKKEFIIYATIRYVERNADRSALKEELATLSVDCLILRIMQSMISEALQGSFCANVRLVGELRGPTIREVIIWRLRREFPGMSFAFTETAIEIHWGKPPFRARK
jgi:hypothetical protein